MLSIIILMNITQAERHRVESVLIDFNFPIITT